MSRIYTTNEIDDLLIQADPYRHFGEDYRRNIASQAALIERCLDRGWDMEDECMQIRIRTLDKMLGGGNEI